MPKDGCKPVDGIKGIAYEVCCNTYFKPTKSKVLQQRLPDVVRHVLMNEGVQVQSAEMTRIKQRCSVLSPYFDVPAIVYDTPEDREQLLQRNKGRFLMHVENVDVMPEETGAKNAIDMVEQESNA